MWNGLFFSRTFCTFGLAGGVILIFQPQTLIGLHSASSVSWGAQRLSWILINIKKFQGLNMTNSSREMIIANNSNIICIHNSTKSDDCYLNSLNEVKFELKSKVAHQGSITKICFRLKMIFLVIHSVLVLCFFQPLVQYWLRKSHQTLTKYVFYNHLRKMYIIVTILDGYSFVPWIFNWSCGLDAIDVIWAKGTCCTLRPLSLGNGYHCWIPGCCSTVLPHR